MKNILKIMARALGGKNQALVPHEIFMDDTFLASFPKSGNTWCSFILASLLARNEGKGEEINFFNVRDFVQEYDDTLRIRLRERRVGGYPRIIKTHSGCSSDFPKVILLVRDPRDVMVSYHHYLKGLHRIPDDMTIEALVRSSSYGIHAWVAHTRGWLERADTGRRVRIFRYEDMLSDPFAVLKKMTFLLGCPASDADIQWAIEHASKDRMKEMERLTRRPEYPLTRSDFQFVRKGIAEQGRDLPFEVKSEIEEVAGDLMRLLGYLEGAQ